MRLKLNDYEPNEAMRIIREWTHLSQVEFAKSIGRSDRTIQAWESGETGYSVEMLLKIAKMYNIEIIIQKKPY
ncbi:helix-turn-helix transcriptional regulator [Acetivibrio sp. MSJd-27]|jgi:DNA-binding helix-turn-helix protein|uniref:helix-turn-helix transcriptional regulator n=1 Tax=Acetivibrio sp. MSJd-27 TaxID=2841523 RepID=UPI0015AA9971|nr:helix-turn-helix transcriptional regulator [Acetivibrio sp. MSJd-27]MBU5449930.1 helix-turn-helix domain-containing protein [Acetivibrio sp. MSJd-27]